MATWGNFELGKEVVYRVVGNEAIILDASTGKHFDLNESGTEIFLGIANKANLDFVLSEQLKKYEQSEETLRKDIQELVNDLLKHQIIRQCE